MRRNLLTSCASSVVIALMLGKFAVAQTTYNTSQQVSTPITSGPVTVTGGSQVFFNAPSTYSGGTTVNGGSTLVINADNQLGNSAGSLTLGDSSANGTLGLSGSVNSARSIILNAGNGVINVGNPSIVATLSGPITGTGALTISGGGTTGGNVNLTGGANSFSGGLNVFGGSSVTYSNDNQLGASTSVVTLGDSNYVGALYTSGGQNITSNRTIDIGVGGGYLGGPGGTGIVYYNGPITANGLTTIASGTVLFSNSSNVQNIGILVNGNATLITTSDAALGSSLANTVTLGDANGHGTLVWGNNLGYGNSTPVTSSRSILLGTGGGTITLTNPNSNTSDSANGIVTLAGRITDSSTVTTTTSVASSVVYSPSYTANGAGLTISAPGAAGATLALTGTNLFVEDIHVESGAILQIGADTALGGYSSTVNTITGQTSYVLSATPNRLVLDGGTLQFSANTTILHPVQLNGNAVIDTQGNTDIIGTKYLPPAVTASATQAAGITDDTISASGATVSGSLTKVGTGTLILDGLNSYTGGTTVSQGTLQLGDANSVNNAGVLGNVTVANGATLTAGATNGAHVGGTIINYGTVAPVTPLTTASLSQGPAVSSAVQTPAIAPVIGPNTATAGAGTTALVTVTGNSNITGGALSATFASGFLHAGTYEIFSSGSMSGSGFSTIGATAAGVDWSNHIDSSIGLTGQIVKDPNSNTYYLVLTQLPSLPGYDRPDITQATTQAIIDDAQQTTGTLLARLAGLRTSALADELGVALTDRHRVRGTSPYGMWVQPTAQNGTASATNGVPGYTTQGGGLLGGIDAEWKPGLSIGVALGYTNSFVKQGSTGSGTISIPRMAVYGGWWRGPFAIDAVAGIGMGSISGSRPVADLVADSSHFANEKTAALQTSAAWSFDGWVIGPAAGVKYLNLRQGSFTESGASLYDFTVASNQVNSLRPFFNTDFTKRLMLGDHWSLVPDIRVGVEHEIEDGIRHLSVQTAGDAQNFLYYGLLPGADTIRIDAGLNLETSRDMAFYIAYNRLQSSSTTSQYVSGGFRYRM